MTSPWPTLPLAQIATVFSDGDWIESKDQSESGIRLIQTGNIGVGEFRPKADRARFVSPETFKRLRCTEIFPGDVLISRLPDPVGRACIVPTTNERMITAVDCTILRLPPTTMIPKFFVYFAQSREYLLSVSRVCTGATRQRISRKSLGSIEVPVPPIAEQARIVAALDEAFAAIADVIANSEQSVAAGQELYESLLDRLTTSTDEKWSTRSLKELTTKIGSGATPRGGRESYKASGIALIRSMNVHDRQFRAKNLAYIDQEQARLLDGVTVAEGDVLLNITGASVARCCVVPSHCLPARVNQHVAIIRCKSETLTPEFLCLLLTARHNKRKLLGIGENAGATRQAITKSEIESFKVAFPALDEQLTLTARLSELEHDIQMLSDNASSKMTMLGELKHALLHTAFAGKLASARSARRRAAPSYVAHPVSAELSAHVLAFAYVRHLATKRDKTFGRVKAQKTLHLFESIGGVDLGRMPIKDAAGPNDSNHMRQAENWAAANDYFEFVSRGNGYDFKKRRDFDKLLAGAHAKLGPHKTQIERVLDILIPLDSQQAEVLATVHAAWNNLLIDGQEPTNEAIIKEARDHWHASKLQIPEQKFRDAIKLIRDKEIIPDGTAKPVRAVQESLL